MKSGPLVLSPYPAGAVDMGQYLSRSKEPSDMERLWIDYVSELAREAGANPGREAMLRRCDRHSSFCSGNTGTACRGRCAVCWRISGSRNWSG